MGDMGGEDEDSDDEELPGLEDKETKEGGEGEKETATGGEGSKEDEEAPSTKA